MSISDATRPLGMRNWGASPLLPKVDLRPPSTTVVDIDQAGAGGSNQAVGIGVFGSGRRWPGVGGPGASWTSRGRVAGCVYRATADG